MCAKLGLRPSEFRAKCLNARHAGNNTKLIKNVNQNMIIAPDTFLIMTKAETHERVMQARKAAGFVTGADAARALNIPVPTYNRYENGGGGISRIAPRLAKLFRVDLDWLLTGRGQMKREPMTVGVTIPVLGLVGAGAAVEMIDDSAGVDAPDEIEMLGEGRLAALQVRGDSQYPRFLHGEYILYDKLPVAPSSLVGKYAVVQTIDGRRLIKTLQRGLGDNRWILESHNAPPEKNVQLVGAWRYLGVLPGR